LSTYKLEEHSQQGLIKDGKGITWEEAEVAAQNRFGVGVWPNATIWMQVESGLD